MKKARFLRFLRSKKRKKLLNLLRKQLTFEFDGIAMTNTVNGEKVAILKLTTPIDKVVGSQFIVDAISNQHIHIIVTDVTEIKVHQDLFDVDEGFEWDEDKSIGSYKGDTVFDVSKKGDVWLTDETFESKRQKLRD